MAKNMRVHELAKELGMTNGEAVDLALTLGVPVKSHSSSLNEAYADMIRRRAVRDGLTRPEQPEEAKPAKKAAAKKSAATSSSRRCHAGRRVVTAPRRDRPAPASTETAPPERTIAEPPTVEPVEADRDVARRRGRRRARAGPHRLVGPDLVSHHLIPDVPHHHTRGGGRRAHADPGRRTGRAAGRHHARAGSRRPGRPRARRPRAARARAGRRHRLQRRSATSPT